MLLSILTNAALWDSYQPGVWQQDLITIPIEAGVLTMSSEFYTRAPEPLWPFRNEVNKGVMEPTRHEKTALAVSGSLIGIGTFSLLAWSNSDFPVWNATAGLIHTHLFTEIATGFAKRTWQRRRPFYDTKMQESGSTVEQDSHSFFSGHASHTMAYSVYLSHVLFAYADNPWIQWGGATALIGGAAWVGAVRVIDGQHHALDVVVGAAAGSAIATAVFWQMQDARAKQVKTAAHKKSRMNVGTASWTSWRHGQVSLSASDRRVGAATGTTTFAPEQVNGISLSYALD